MDILIAALKKLPKSAPVQVVILGTGKKALETQIKALDKQFPGMAAGVVKFSSPMAHCITAGADYMLVPSRFEPCGLIQLHAMQYGTVPLVASTGGLVDTVKEGVTGFQMGAMDPDGLTEADAGEQPVRPAWGAVGGGGVAGQGGWWMACGWQPAVGYRATMQQRQRHCLPCLPQHSLPSSPPPHLLPPALLPCPRPRLPVADAVAQTIMRAAQVYGTPTYKAMRDRCISQDLSWAQPAKKWEAVLTELKFGPGPTPEASADKAAVTTPKQKLDFSVSA